jgi:ATP-dependent Lon protease
MPLSEPLQVPEEVPVLGLRGAVLFPASTAPLALHSAEAVAAARAAEQTGGLVAVALRRFPMRDGEPFHRVATVGIVQDLLGGAQVRCLVQGLVRVELCALRPGSSHATARLRRIDDAPDDAPAPSGSPRDRRLRERLVEDGPDAFPELSLAAIRAIARVTNRSQLADLVLANLPIAAEEQQRGLAERNVETRLALASSLLDRAAADLGGRRGVVDAAVASLRMLVWRAWMRSGRSALN